MGKSSNRSTEYFFTGRYEDDNDGNTIHAIGVGGVINAYGGNDYIVVGSIGATVNTTWGHDTVVGGAGYLNINDTSGSLTVKGGSGYTAINKTHNGTIEFAGAAGGLNINHTGDNGAINYAGVSGYNGITRKGVKGDISFKGAGGYNSLYSDVEQGNIHFAGAGAYNRIIRKGADSDLSGEGIEYADAKEIILKSATMNGSWIGSDNQVSGIKSTREPNTYLFAFADSTYTKIHKIQLRNDPATGKLTYHSTAWYKEGNHLQGLEKQDISAQNGFVDVGIDGAYTLSNLVVEHQQATTIQAVEQQLTENEWVTYGSGVRIKAADVTLSDARMGGYAVYQDGTKVDVTAVKSHRQPNTYVYAKKLGVYTKIVVIELRNHPETGILQYIARPWYKEGDHTINLADKIISESYGYTPMGTGGYSLSDLHYSARMVQTTTERVASTHEYSDQSLFPVTERRETSGDVRFEGAGGGNVIKSNVTKGNVYFSGAGIANVIEHTSAFGDTEFNGAGGANVIIKKGKEGNLKFNGAGIANVLLHQGKRGDMEVNAGGAANVLVRVGDGRYLAHLLAVGNISIHKGNGNSRVSMGGGFNTHTQIGHGDAVWSGVGGANVLTQVGQGKVSAILAGGANILTKIGEGSLESGMLGGANIITHISNHSDATKSDNTKVIALGGANVLTKKGRGDLLSVMGGGANVLTHVGDGNTSGILLGGANILTKVGNGDTTGIMLGLGNVLTHVGDGQTLGVMAGAGNIFTKVGDGETIAAMLAFGNIFTHVGEGNACALMAGGGNIFTKVGNGDALALMLSFGNVFTHIGDGMSVALMIAKGNIATKAGNGDALAAMIGKGNIFTQIGHGSTFAAMIGGANILTKVGNDLTAALMIGKANIYTHVGEGTSIGLFAGTANIMTKVGDGTTLAAMFGKANIMTHVGDGMTGVLALGKANIVTKVGNDFMGVVASSEANVVTHIGEGTTAALLNGKGNILTKVGDGTAVGLLVSKIGNIMTHIGDGDTIGFAKGEANIITKVGDGTGVNAVWGKANILTHYGNGDRYNFAKGEANVITKVGDGQEITVVQGQANIITHIGNGDDYTGSWGKANVITKVGDGRNVVLAKGDANIVTQIGEGDSFNALWSQGNVVTKVGDGIQATVAKGKGNITTTVGDGLSVTAVHGDLNVNTKVGDGVSVNVAWGKYNVNTRVGDGLNISVMKGAGNANIRVGDGLNINASYARNNVAVQVGNGDFYSLAVATSNTQSNKLGALFDNVKQTLLGSAGSQGISYLVNGDEANTSGTHKGRGAIDLPEVSSLDGFKLTEVDEVTSDLSESLQGAVSEVDTPDTEAMQRSLSHEKRQAGNLIVNGDFEQGSAGWHSTNGIEAHTSAVSYGLSKEGHGERVSELDVDINTRIYQDINGLVEGEPISVSFDYAMRAGLSDDNGIDVLWNGELVFSIWADDSGKAEWKNKTLTLTAQAGSNRLEFAGTGVSDGLGFVLDNVVARSEWSDKDIADYVEQDQAATNALQDKENAEADRQRLAQEKEKQLAAISDTQAQLENTDLTALNANGQSQREAIRDEAQSITQELIAKTKGLEALNDYSTYHGQSGQQWRDQYADGLLGNIQTQLDSAKETAQQQLEHSQQASAERLGEVKDAVAKSESGANKGEQDRQHSMQRIEDARADIEFREQEAIAHQQQAQKAGRDGKSAAQKAEQRGQHAVSAAEIKTAQVQSDAKAAKLDSDKLPSREKAAGSGLSGQIPADTDTKKQAENQAGKTHSFIDAESAVQTENEFAPELQYLEEDLGELDNAKAALDRLQINAGIRARKQHITPNVDNTGIAQPSVSKPSSTVSTDETPAAPVRRELSISGLDLSGLNALGAGKSQPEHTDTPENSGAALRAQKVANIYQWLDSDNNLATENYIPVPGFERVDADIPDVLRQKMVTFVEGYLNGTENSIPKEQRTSLAKLFVDATIDYNWDKRVEFVSRLEHYGYSFEPVHGDKSIVSFWSGRNFKQYRNILDAAQTDGKKVVYDIDVKGNSFAIELNKTLMRWGGIFLDPDVAEQNALKSVINASARSNTGFWSSLYATGSRDDVYVIAEGGLRLGNYFWNVELPVLRQLQREGLVGEIRLLDKAAKEYQGVLPENIGRRLTDAGVSVKARFDSLSFEEQERLLAQNPTGYKPDTLIDLDIKTSAIDTLLNQALPFYGLRTERNLLVRESDDYDGFEIRPWPGRNSDGSEITGFKSIIVEDTDNAEQVKAVERFILANYDNYQQLPDTLYLVEDRIVSHDNGRTRILAEKTDGSWSYKPKTELMSADELQAAAYVKGKIRGDSYQHVLDALEGYENELKNSRDYDLEAIEKLSGLRQQVEGYLLGHPDSERTPALKNLLSQIQVRLNETLAIAESAVESTAKGSFSDLYNKLSNASLKESKHLYIDEQGNFVTRGKSNIQTVVKTEWAEKAVEQVKTSVAKEYGQSVAEAVFSNLHPRDLAKDGKGLDVSGLKKIHKAIEQQLSPVSATLFIWKPSDHSRLGHAALQIGHGRMEITAENAAEFNEKHYVSWWPKGGKSTSVRRIFDVSTAEHPDVKLRWRDLSQPAGQNDALELDVASEEKDNFGLHDGSRKLERFIEKLQAAKGVDARFEEISEGFAMAALANPNLLKSAGVPEHISRPFMQQWEDGSIDMLEVGKNFAEALRTAAKQQTPELTEKRVANVIRQFAERELSNIQDFKASEPDQGRVFRINLAGLDVAAMQAEWHKISQNPDARYQLLTGNCSSIVAKVLKAGGADQVIGHKWQPHFGVWTPTELFNYAQALQESQAAQAENTVRKQNRRIGEDLTDQDQAEGNDKSQIPEIVEAKRVEKVAIENDGTPPQDQEPFNPVKRFLNHELFGAKDARRNINEDTQILLDYAVESGTAEKVTLGGDAGRLTGYYHVSDQGQAEQGSDAATSQNPSRKVILFIHGSGSSAEEQSGAIQNHYQKQGIDLLAVNMRGYGSSDGRPNEKGLYQDARTMFHYLVNDRGIKPENIIIHGYSMGGAVAADLARYAEHHGQPVSGLLLDRPMPSMTKAITAHEVPNPAGITGVLAKAVNGQFSVEKNLQGISKQTPIMLLTDNEGLGDAGEKLRTKLVTEGYQVSGEQTIYDHTASNRLMNQYAEQIVSGLLPAKDYNDTAINEVKKPLKDNTPEAVERVVNNQHVETWEKVAVKPHAEGGESRFNSQVIIQTENDPVALQAAASLAGKHPDTSVIVQLDANGQYRVVYGDPAQLSGKLRWQIVGHGRDESAQNLTRMGGYSADELALKLKQFSADFRQAGIPEHISLVGCSLIGDDKREGFARRFISALDDQGLRTSVSARSSEVAVDSAGRKHTRDAQEQWVHKLVDNKIVLGWNDKGELESYSEHIRRGISENDIALSLVGHSGAEAGAKGAIAENTETFHAPEQREKENDSAPNSNAPNDTASDRHLSYSGNIQVQVGEGEFTAINWGTTNVGIKVGNGGFKSLAFGDNNVMVHIGNGDSKHSVDIAGYQAFEGAQLFVGNRNISFNLGRSNDLIVMLEKSIPTPPLINPFDGAARISGVLQSISSQNVAAQSSSGLFGSADWLTAQEQQWTLEGAKKYVRDLSGLDLTSSVKYETLTELNTENERSSRGLKNDLENTLNKKYNQWLGGEGNKPELSQLSRADKFRQANEKLAFNFAVGGQGADIQVTTGNWNFMFGDNIQSILDTNLGSVFGLMTQEYTATGMAKTTFTFSPTDLPRQIKNKLLGNLAGVSADTTLADIFGVDYTPDGRIVSRSGQPVDGVAIMQELLEIIGEFSGDQLKSFTDPQKLLDGLKAGLNTGTDGINSFAESHGLKAKAPDDTSEDKISLNEGDKPTEQTESEQPERAFGFNALNLPNLFATLFSQDKQTEMQSLVSNLKENLTADLLNMQDNTFDFLRNSGHLQGDGDIHVSLGNYNFNWGGDGKDLGAYLGDNNNFWGGRGDDVFYSVGTSNIFAGGEGNDLGVLMGRENMMFGGAGNDVAVLAGHINYAYMGEGDDQVFAFGEGGVIEGGKGRDYIVASGNFNRIDAGEDQDYVVTIGNHNQVLLGAGDDFATVFGNYNRIDGTAGNNAIKLMGYHAVINGGAGNDHLIADVVSKFSRFNGGEGNNLLVLGGYQNHFKGGSGVNSFVVSGDVIDNVVEDIKLGDRIIFNNINWQNLWFQRSGYDLVLLTNRNICDTSGQGQFEALGSVTFTDYFNGNRADIITRMGNKDTQGECEYTALSASAVDTLVQAMSGFAPDIGDSGFIDFLDSQTKSTIIAAWADTTSGKSKLT
ncbi:MARTX multifunctional-autoprocessing repeats-in-toxin holotoxin RtxA [Xenorhabdus sp. PB30.3]|uniref:MARTX multifunctional-autoprocessing repeats-in-toxin holotoxin RtxA n=1 Tax=Xenorhabdus sp. PB30.3 TaxID=2788941 RepID=UPI001E3F85CE|nr:MARTX multifunctional-autoprocessing repeats-in-toxin holotoxin RtxA [Xenorhabdus sp. PB30.3]MCC8378158.1 MARTX multifunctional-autoprocessing repeats-in-toxin holotoxin RtxA [Xenorhabdus sp. PB30.3]